MSSIRVAQYSILTVGFAVYAYQLYQDVPIDVKNLNADCLSAVIASDDVCDIAVSNVNRGLFVRNDTLNLEILKAKFDTFFSSKYFTRFLGEQIQFLHIIDEAFLAKRFVICASFMVICITMIEIVVVRRMGNLIKSYRDLKRLEAEETTEWAKCIREFSQEKIIVLTFCIVRSFSSQNHKHYIDFGEYVRDSFSLRTRSTDITLFACWYCLLAVCHVSSHSIFHRYLKTIPLLQRNIKTRLRGQSVFVIMFFALNSLVIMSIILVGAAVLSYAFIHPDYSTILVLESYRVFIRSLYVVDRLSMSISASRMGIIDAQTQLTEQEITEKIVNGQEIAGRRSHIRNIYVVSTLLVTFLLNVFYAITGLVFNRKMLAMGFVFGANQVIDDIVNAREYSLTELI